MKIFLLGMMGSGKSYWMNILAGSLALPQYDLDLQVEKTEGRPISRIFRESGEDYFRKIESAILKSFAHHQQFIMATGGGTPCFFNNMEWMNEQGLTIWLDEPIETLVKRLMPQKHQRPLIAHTTEETLYPFLENMKAQRSAFYNKARYVLRGNELTESRFLQIIKDYTHA